ncbi:MAG: class I SAM-dependent methyltransferase [Micromonosporaceae bacterium]
MDDELDALLTEQVAYYRARATEYDATVPDVFGADRAFWDRLVGQLPIRGDVVELACGTGRWTPVLAARAAAVTAVDAAPEMIAIARERVGSVPGGKGPVEFVTADLFTWRAPRRYDSVFFGFWLSHVPPSRFAEFWSTMRAALKPDGHACFLDTNDREQDTEEVIAGQPAPAVRRRLNDGSEYRVVKVFYGPEDLTARLARLGWSADIRQVGTRFLIGTATPELFGQAGSMP